MLLQLFRTSYINVFKRLTTLLILSYDPYGGVVKFHIKEDTAPLTEKVSAMTGAPSTEECYRVKSLS